MIDHVGFAIRRTRVLRPLGVAALALMFGWTIAAGAAEPTNDEAAIRALIDKMGLAWQAEKPSAILQEIVSDKGFAYASPKPDSPSEAAIVDKQAFCRLMDSWVQQHRPKKHDHQVRSITVIGPLAYELGVTKDVAADGAERSVEVLNAFAKDETGWKLIYSTVTDDIRKALASSPAGASGMQQLSEQQTRDLEQGIKGLLVGIGVEIEAQPDGVFVKAVIAGGPADNAGLQDEETITAINGQPAGGMTNEQAVSLLKGPVGTSVKLTVRPKSGASREVNVIRGTFVVSGCKSRILEPNIGLLTITGFNEQTPGEVRQAISQFQKQDVRGLVVDLRKNQGGLGSAVREIAGMFVDRGAALWQTQNVGPGRPTIVRGEQLRIVRWPVVVLVSGKTSGAGELLACALRAGGGAKLFGENTAGKGSFSSLDKRPDGTSQKVVAGYFLTAEGQPIDGRGIAPDRQIDPKMPPEEALKIAAEELRTTLKP
jgi:C-terminal peptidase prc